MQALNFGLECVEVSVVDQHVISMAQALFAARLGLEDSLHLLFAGVVAQQRALNLQGLRGVDHQYALGGLVLPGFDQQRRH